MPKKGGVLTPMEREFAKHFARTCDARYAAEKAGYGNPATRGSELAHKPAIIEAARAKALEDVATLIIPLAVSRHIETLSKCGPGNTLNKAIEMAYKYGLGENAEKPNKQPHEMTGAELAEAIATLKRAAADKAKPVVDLAPIEAADNVFG